MADGGGNSTGVVGPQFVLTTGGVQYSGWTSLSITSSLEQLAQSFSMQMTDQWAGGKKPIPISKGDLVNVDYINTTGVVTPVTTGYVDEPTLDYDSTRRTLGLTGRAITCDLVDCPAIKVGPPVKLPGPWKNATIIQIATDLLAPFLGNLQVGAPTISAVYGPNVSVQPGPIPGWVTISPGETVFQVLERLARRLGLLMTTNGAGNLVFDNVGLQVLQTTLVHGGLSPNILKCHHSDSLMDRFSHYIVQSQEAGGGSAGDNASPQSHTASAVATDAQVPRYRPTIIQDETGATGKALQARANWEASVRAARANRVVYIVDGWEHSAGLWQPNYLVPVQDADAELQDNLLIATCTYTRSNDDGTHTELTLTPKGAYTPQPLSPTTVKQKPNILA